MEFLVFGILAMAAACWVLSIAIEKKLRSYDERLKESFKALSLDAMDRNSKLFLDLAKTSLDKYQDGAKTDLEHRQKAIDASLQPLKESLKQLDESQRELEKKRAGAYASLTTQIESMASAERDLRREMGRLIHSLRSPHVSGAWGQVHLRRVLEIAGLLNHCDFYEQRSVEAEGKTQRPDLLIHLPGDKQIVIDAKTPLTAYLDASDSEDEDVKKKKLQEHAMLLKRHVKELSSKEYWKQFEQSPEYVILFLPAEAFYSSALQADPSLIEHGAGQNVLIATPTTLIAILRAIALTWKQESLSRNARDISQLGQELYDRISVFCEHWNKAGRHLGNTVEAFNQSVASLESRVLVTARKLKEIGQIQKEVPEPLQIERAVRSLHHDHSALSSNNLNN